MANTLIKALIGFSDGVMSLGIGDVASVEATKAAAFISAGLASEYTEPIVPSGTIAIDANGTYDVADKASAVINVGVVTLSYNVNGGSGSISAVRVGKGTAVELDDGSTITPPTGKIFNGWRTNAGTIVESPYVVTSNTLLYAVYADEGAE